MEDSPLQWIDSHMHVDYHGLDAAAVVAEMDRFQIERAWILTWAYLEQRTSHLPIADSVRSIRGLTARMPDRSYQTS